MKPLLELLALAAIPSFSFGQVPAALPAAEQGRAVELPPGPAARAFAGVGPDTRAAVLPSAPSVGLDAPVWRTKEPWQAWAEALRAEAAAATPDAQRRAKLARIALAQGRWDDAWEHFASTGSDPAVCAALLPQFLPGVLSGIPSTAQASGAPTIFAVGPGGIIAALPDGVLLRPALPPPSVPAAEVLIGRGWIERREMRLEGLHIGAATLAMKVRLESDGIQIDFDHRGGGAAHVRVVLPEQADFALRVAYVDWVRQDEFAGVLEVNVSPGDETHTLFGRFRPRPIAWPTNLPEGAPRFLTQNGLEFSFPQTAPDAEMFEAASTGFASLLGLAVSTKGAVTGDFAGIKIDLGDPTIARRKFTGMISLSERFALRRPRR